VVGETPLSTGDLLSGVSVVTIGVNVPIGEAGRRLAELGTQVTKVEPPTGDPLELAAASWYRALVAGQTTLRLDLKHPDGRRSLDELLASSDLLLTSFRPSALARLGLGRNELAERFPTLVQVAIVGSAAPLQEVPGHDLTYVAVNGLVAPPDLPRTLLADLGGAERAVSTGLALLLARPGGLGLRYAEVALADAARVFADPLEHGMTAPGGILGGGLPCYGLYETLDGWVAVAALEPHFAARLLDALGVAETAGHSELATAFIAQSAAEWELWAAARDLPLAAVRHTVEDRERDHGVTGREPR